MRNFFLLLILLVSIGAQGCKKTQYPPYAPEFKFLSKEANGLFLFRSTGLGNGADAAVGDAERNVFYHIIFKGIPGGELNVPMVEKEGEAKAKHKDYFDKFFSKGGYQVFMLSSTPTSKLTNVSGGQQISVDVKVNCTSLRKDLEQNQVIRKFGF